MAEQNELVLEHMYTQILTGPNVNPDDLAVDIKQYVTDVLNKNMAFYKAYVSTSQYQDSRLFRINFYLFSSDPMFWNEELQRVLKENYLDGLLGRWQGLQLTFESTDELIHEEKREPHYSYSQGENQEEEEVGCWNVPGNNCFQKFLNWWLIVPSVQWDFFDLLYQMYTFDITHQGFLPKMVHFITIPTNVLLFMSFLAQFEFGFGYAAFSVNASIICLLVLSLLYIAMGFMRQSWLWGFVATIVLFVCWMTGNLWYHAYKTPENPWYNPTNVGTNPILWSYITSFIQASSHMIVPQLPPYITSVHHWESLHVFFCRKSNDPRNKCRNTLFVIMSLMFFPILSVSVAWFSWPHLIGTEVIYIMAGIGYKPQDFEEYRRVVEKAELSGDPYLDHYPTDARHLMNNPPPPFVHRLRSAHLVPENPSHHDVIKSMAKLMLLRRFFSHGMRKRRLEDQQHMLAVSKGLSHSPIFWPQFENVI